MGGSRRSRRRQLAIASVLAIVVVFGIGTVLEPTTNDPPEVEHVSQEDLIQPREEGSYLWPYTSRGETVTQRTLAINLVVHGPDDAVRRSLTDRTSFEFEPEDPAVVDDEQRQEPGLVIEDDRLEWADAHGSVRHTYIDATPRDADAAWMSESYQLSAGTYLGERHHIRAYTHPEEDWTAIQAHTDYWDWFRLRHTVPDIREAGLEIENDYLEARYVEEVRREYYGIEGGYSDGWLSVVELSPQFDDEANLDDPDEITPPDSSNAAGDTDTDTQAAGINDLLPADGIDYLLAGLGLLGLFGAAGVLAPDTQKALVGAGRAIATEAARQRRSIALGAVLGGILLGVRVTGIGLETTVTGLHPKTIAAGLYPVLALGLPITTFLVAREARPKAAGAFAVVGLGTAFVIDLAMVSVTIIPVRLLLHRIGLLLAIGTIAYGSALGTDRGREFLVVGVVAWLIGLGLPLLDLI